MTDFNFEKPDNRIFPRVDGIFFSDKNAHISVKTMDFLNKSEKEEWHRMDTFFDFKKQALALRKDNKDGRIVISQKRRSFASGGFSAKAKRGRYLFLKKQGDMYIFTYSSER